MREGLSFPGLCFSHSGRDRAARVAFQQRGHVLEPQALYTIGEVTYSVTASVTGVVDPTLYSNVTVCELCPTDYLLQLLYSGPTKGMTIVCEDATLYEQ
jgi:hypothetical protein